MAPPARATPGQTLESRFVLLEEIGRGGMSTVFKATDLEQGGKVVAVKVPLPQFSSGLGSWSMFQREAEIGARLDHPYILRFVPLAPRKSRGHVVTEYVAGPTLASRVGKGRRLEEAEALRIASRLSDAVDYMHRRQVVHYDLKPENVILCEDGSIRLIDLGMAHEVVTGRFALSGSAPPFATTDYVAPEQIGRKRGKTSVDIYALGAMLYEMLTGHPPFEGDDPFVVASARQIGDPRAPRSLCPTISAQAEEIVLRALRRDPTERYATAAELKAALDAPTQVVVSGLATRLVEVTPARRRLRWLRFVSLTALLPLAVLVGGFLLLWWALSHPAGAAQRQRGKAASSSAMDLGADALVGEYLEQDGVLEATVEHVDLLHAAGERVEAALHLRDHAGVDDAPLDELGGLRRRQRSDDLPLAAPDRLDVRQEDELLGPQGLGHLPGRGVCVDVQGVAFAIDADRRDDGDEARPDELVDHVGHDLDDLADAARVDRLSPGVAPRLNGGQLSRANEAVVLSGEAHGAPALLADQPDDLLVDAPAEHHLDHVHRLVVGDAEAGHELRPDAEPAEGLVDLRPAAVDDNDVDPDIAQEADVPGEAGLQIGVDHRVAAVLDDEGAAVEPPDVRERLVENGGLFDDVLHALSYPGVPTAVQGWPTPIVSSLTIGSPSAGAHRRRPRYGVSIPPARG
jgi:Protein kinase domain